MARLSTAEMRRWAEDLRQAWRGSYAEAKADAHATLMISRADLEDVGNNREPTIADKAVIKHIYPIIGRTIISGNGIESMENEYNDALANFCESRGIYCAWSWRRDPSAEDHCYELIYLWIGSKERGPEAQYTASSDTWYELKSRGNFGKRYACGGTWSGSKCEMGTAPEIYQKLLEVIMDYKKIEQAKARVRAAELRVRAAHQQDHASAYIRQASSPIYPGQEIICANKAAIVTALADKTRAEADLIEATAGL